MTLLITTSRNPSRRTRSFVKDLASVIKGSIKVNRGKKTLDDLLHLVRSYGSQGLIMVLERRGNPSALSYYVDDNVKLKRVMIIKLASVKLLREIRGAQRPVRMLDAVIDEKSLDGEVPKDVVDAIRDVLNVRTGANIVNKPDCVKIKFRYEGRYTSLTFVSISDGKVCGPELRILKVVRDGL